MRETRAMEGPRITNKTDAMETVNWIQDAFLSETSSNDSFSSSSSYDDSRENISDGCQIVEETIKSIESLVLYGKLS